MTLYKENLIPCLDLFDPRSSYDISGDIGMTRGPLFTRMFVTSTPRPVNEAIEYFVDSPGNIRRFPMTRAKAALLPALTRNPFNYVYFHGKDWLQTSSAIFRPQPGILHSIFHQKILVKK